MTAHKPDRRTEKALRGATTITRVSSQLNHIAVKVLISSATSPRFRTWFVKDASARTYCCRMSIVDVNDRQCDLRTGGRLLLRRIKGKMKVGPLQPGDFCVPSANPAVLNPIVARMQV